MFSLKTRRALARLKLLPLPLIALCATVFGQTSTGEVNGTVTDSAGAAVPGAIVKLINQATKIESSARPNQSGYFIIVNVRPGSYVMRVEAQGFKAAQIPAFRSEEHTSELQ